MLNHVFSAWFWSGSPRSGVCSFTTGSALFVLLILLTWICGIHTSLSLGPGGEFPALYDFIFYTFSHEELTSLLHSLVLLLCFGPSQERRWGTLTFLSLAVISTVLLPPIYALFLFVTGDEASRVCGFSATQLALLTAQCRQGRQKRVLRCLPLWSLPWLFLLLDLFLLPGAPGLLHFYAICLGLNYSSEFTEILQRVEGLGVCSCLPPWAYVSVSHHSSNKHQLPIYVSPTHRPEPYSDSSHTGLEASSGPPLDGPSFLSPWRQHPSPGWHHEGVAPSDAQLLEDQFLRAGILASLQDAPEGGAEKVEVPKSSVSSLRLQQLEKMGFPMDKAVVALAATGQLDGAISLLIEDQVGEEAVVVSKGKKPPST
ncbi:rhomboid domain-containing protein 3-like [Hoplias malabaricus]|uniref:rhomboid domain-containing protein 3-like n=1 Tax=Hoplias malabaricus TaxID=27720 RepID=UPI003461B674